jgi:hypothetical protein
MSSNDVIERLIVDASEDPLNSSKNLAIAVEYEKLGQSASAVGFYLRAAEYGHDGDSLVAYSSLLRVSICIDGQKNRDLTVTNVILQAMAYLPDRPEAYFLMSRFYEKKGSWQEAYTFAILGQKVLGVQSLQNLPVSIDGYDGSYVLAFQRAISAWWIGRAEESLVILRWLAEQNDLTILYRSAVEDNIKRIENNNAAV